MRKLLPTVLIVFLSSSAFSQFNCGDTLLDTRDGQKYPTVLIGNQCWMAKNLNIGTMTDISVFSSDNQNIEKYCYDGLQSNCDSTGGLYRWNEMMDYVFDERTQGVCPNGWYLPNKSDWDILQSNVNNVPELLPGGSTGFDALYSGYIESNNTYGGSPDIAYFWSASINNGGLYRIVTLSSSPLYEQNTGTDAAMSVRCLVPHDVVGVKSTKNNCTNCLRVYPSISTGDFLAEYNLPNHIKEANIDIINMVGIVVKTHSISNHKKSLNLSLSSITSGVYFVRLTTKNGFNEFQRIVKVSH